MQRKIASKRQDVPWGLAFRAATKASVPDMVPNDGDCTVPGEKVDRIGLKGRRVGEESTKTASGGTVGEEGVLFFLLDFLALLRGGVFDFFRAGVFGCFLPLLYLRTAAWCALGSRFQYWIKFSTWRSRNLLVVRLP